MCTHFDFRSPLHILFPFPPTGRDMRRKKWEVSSLVTLFFSVNDRILREIWESQTSVISVPDLALADRAIYRARVWKTHKGRHKNTRDLGNWSLIPILKRMWGLPVRKRNVPTEFTLFFNVDKVTCNTNKATRSKTKKLTFSLVAVKFCLVLRATPAVPTQTVLRLRINTFLVGKIVLLLPQKTALCCVLIFFHVEIKWSC